MRPFLALLLLACAGLAIPQPVRIAVAPIVVSDPCKFAGPDREATAAIMAAAAFEYLQKACDATDFILVSDEKARDALEGLKTDFAKPKERTAEKLQAFGKALEANYALFVLVDWTEQKNPEIGAVASNPVAAKSTNRVRIRVWLQDVSESRLLMDGKHQVEGEAKGPYFGTVNPRDMTGDPDSKGIMIRLGHKKRAEWLGKALVAALKEGVRAQLGLKDPASIRS